jgi:hypothetical protein
MLLVCLLPSKLSTPTGTRRSFVTAFGAIATCVVRAHVAPKVVFDRHSQGKSFSRNATHIKLTGTISTSFDGMHSVLRIAELQHSISAGCDRKSLASLARTCKAFHETALDVLWRDDIEIAVLLRVMPPDLWVADDYRVVVCALKALCYMSCHCNAYFSTRAFAGRSHLQTLPYSTSTQNESILCRIALAMWGRKPYVLSNEICQNRCSQTFARS